MTRPARIPDVTSQLNSQTTAAAREEARRTSGEFGEQARKDPGTDIIAGPAGSQQPLFDTLQAANIHSVLNTAQLWQVTDLAGLLGSTDFDVRIETSCGGQRYAALELEPSLDSAGQITKVSCEFHGDAAEVRDLRVSSTWKWPEKVGPYDEDTVTMLVRPSRDRENLMTDLAELAAAQQLLDERVNKPAHRRNKDLHFHYVQVGMHHERDQTIATIYIGDGSDTFTVQDGHIVQAQVRTARYGDLFISGSQQLDEIAGDLGRTLSMNVPGTDKWLPNWRDQRATRAQVEKFLFTPDPS